ncbi:MAG: hypothetical protein PHV55_06770 [Candidatus Omnitrophica bacterium]|nr:hypothetical protein [Candidatus Omnitrophota bacterium]
MSIPAHRFILLFFFISLVSPAALFAAKEEKTTGNKTTSLQPHKTGFVKMPVSTTKASSGNVTVAVPSVSEKTTGQNQASYVPDENDVKSFVYRWFAWLDHQVEDFLFLYHLSKEDLLMEMPEVKITTHAGFIKWYQAARSETESIMYEVGDITVKHLAGGKYSVALSVRCKSKTIKGKTRDVKYKQNWELSVSPAGRLTINRYRVKKVK